MKAAAENMRQALLEIAYDELDTQNKLTYDILIYQLRMMNRCADYLLYEEPLGLVSGVQTQLPVVLSEYQFYDREDVDTYLALLKTTGEYFDSLIRFEREKSEAGLFMPDYAADQVAEQCQAFIDMGNSNYLYSTFADRIEDVDELDEKEKSDYIQDNALMVNDYVIPAYEKLISEIQNLKGVGKMKRDWFIFPEERNIMNWRFRWLRDLTGLLRR